MVHRREIDGNELVLGNHGALWGNAMTWWDTETGSVWSQPIGQAILGPLTGEQLELLPSTLSTWADWKAAHPDTFALDVSSGDDGFDLESMAIVVELGPESVAVPIPELRRSPVVNHVVNDVPIAVVLQPDTDTWSVFSRRLDEDTVELKLVDGVLAEVGGDRRFDPTRGLGLIDDTNDSDSGTGPGQNLDPLPGFTSFPDDYVTFFPDGTFWQPGP
jgi:hypothetical protein